MTVLLYRCNPLELYCVVAKIKDECITGCGHLRVNMNVLFVYTCVCMIKNNFNSNIRQIEVYLLTGSLDSF